MCSRPFLAIACFAGIFVVGCKRNDSRTAPDFDSVIDVEFATKSDDAQKPGEEKDFDVGEGVVMRFCWIPATKGKVTLGSPQTELQRHEDEVEHQVELDGFWMSKFEVTQRQYRTLTGKNPSCCSPEGPGNYAVKGIDTNDFPVETVSWDDAQVCIKRMKSPQGFRIALPSEAQWEWAARGGTGNKKPFSWGNELNGDKANCDGKFPFGTSTPGPYVGRTTKVGTYETKAMHPWGLCDIAGNVWEWCEDYSGDYSKLPKVKNPVQTVKDRENRRILRGGGWNRDCRVCRCFSSSH